MIAKPTGAVVEPAASLNLTASGGMVTLRWTGTPGVLYQVEGRNINSPSTEWEAVGAPTTSFTVSEIQTAPTKIYRVGIYTNTTQYSLNVGNNDSTPPTIPQTFTVVSTNVGQVALRWKASTDPGPGQKSGVQGYEIYRGVGVSVPPTNFLTTVLVPNTNLLDTTVGTGTTYSYRVRAFDFGAPANFSGFSTTNWATTPCIITTSNSPPTGGTSTGGGTKTFESSVTVTATVTNSCYTFVNWTESGTNVSTSASYTFTANRNRTLVANFAPATYTVTTSSSPSAGGTTSGGGSKACGSSVTVTATANACYTFVNWTEGATVVSTSSSYTFTASANRTLVANFALTTYSVTTSSSPSAGGTTSGGGTVNCGSSVTVTATANACYTFVNWTEGATVVSTSPSYTFTASANRTLVANFALTTYSVTTSSSPSAGGTTSGGGTKNCGSSVTVTATANAGYSFSNWTEGATVVSSSASYTFTASGNRSLTANFTTTASGGDITSNLAGYWTFDSANVSGTTALDSTANANNGTLQGTVLPTIVSGRIAQAVNLDGVSDLVNVPNSASLNITGPFTVSAWVNFNALPSPGKYPNVIAKLTSPSGYYGYGLFWNGSGVSGIIGPGSAQWYIPSAHTPVAGAWNHYAAVFDGTTFKLYVNGNLYSQVAANAPGNTTGIPVKMGPHYSSPASYGYLNGKVDDARIYSRALSAVDVTQLYTFTGSTGCTYTITTSSSPSAGGTTSGGGTVNCGSSVTVTATANACYSFVNWTEGATVVSTSPSYTFTANASRTLVANFALTTYSVTTSSSPSAGGTTSGGGTVNCGSSVTVTATANACYTFVNWTEGATVVSTSPSYTFTAGANRTLVANFALTTYAISTSSSPSIGGSTSGGGTKNCGSSVTVTATPAAGYNFVNWTEGATVVSTSASYTFTASANRTLVANFSLATCTYLITTLSSPVLGGSTSGGGVVNCASSVTVIATPASGYSFVNWTEGATVVSTSSSYTFTANANRSLVANFTQGSNIPPVANAGTNKTSAVGTNVTFNGGNSYDPDGTITNYIWAFGDGVTASGMNVSHAYAATGSYTATLTVTDNLGATGSSNASVVVTTPGQLKWVRASTAAAGPSAVQLAVATDQSGNGVTVGWFSGTVDFGTGPISTTSTLDTDGFIVKRDNQGNPLWTKRLGNSGADAATGVAVDKQGNIIVTGYFTTNVDFGGTSLTSVPSPIPGGAAVPDIYVAKYTPTGTLLWVKGFGGGYDDRGVSVAVDTNNNVVIASEIKSINVDFGGVTLSTLGNYDVVLAKLTAATGSTLWAKSFGGTGVDIPSAVTVDRSGDVVLTGSFVGGKLAKYSGANGNLIWTKTPTGAFNGIATDPATGNIFLTGGNAGIFLSCYDPSGQTNLWTVSSGADTDAGTAVAVDGNGNIAITGKAANAINFGTWPQDPWLFGNGQPNFFVAAFTVSGNLPPTYRWTKVVGVSSTGSSGGTGISYDSLGHILAGGFFTATIDFGGISATTTGGYNAAFLAQYAK